MRNQKQAEKWKKTKLKEIKTYLSSNTTEKTSQFI